MTCQRNKPMLNDANKNDHECVFYIICLEQNFYIDVLLRNMPTHNILNEKQNSFLPNILCLLISYQNTQGSVFVNIE